MTRAVAPNLFEFCHPKGIPHRNLRDFGYIRELGARDIEPEEKGRSLVQHRSPHRVDNAIEPGALGGFARAADPRRVRVFDVFPVGDKLSVAVRNLAVLRSGRADQDDLVVSHQRRSPGSCVKLKFTPEAEITQLPAGIVPCPVIAHQCVARR
jgi:hypothetical protein